MAEALAYLREFNFASLALRLFLSMLIGGLIGFEREKKHRPAGFRTYMFVAMGAALTILLGQFLSVMIEGPWNTSAVDFQKTDVSRFGAQVINGVGFLGAGTIILTKRNEIRGLTTAAGLWASACMGLAIGAGFYECVLISSVLIILSMSLLSAIEKKVMTRSTHVQICAVLENMLSLHSIAEHMKSEGYRIYDTDIMKDNNEHPNQVTVVFSLKLPKRILHVDVLAELSKLDGIINIEEI